MHSKNSKARKTVILFTLTTGSQYQLKEDTKQNVTIKRMITILPSNYWESSQYRDCYAKYGGLLYQTIM